MQQDTEESKAEEKTPLQLLLSVNTKEGQQRAAKTFINSLIEEADCMFILNGTDNGKKEEPDTICNDALIF